MAPHELAALVARSEALNRQYGLDRTSRPAKVVEQPAGSGNGFGWGAFGIGAAASWARAAQRRAPGRRLLRAQDGVRHRPVT